MSSTSACGARCNGFTMGDEFKEYLNRTGASDAIAAALQNLYKEPEWPQDPREYIHKQLALRCGAPSDPLAVLQEAQRKIAELQKKEDEVREKLARKHELAAPAREKAEKPKQPEEPLEESLAAILEFMLESSADH